MPMENGPVRNGTWGVYHQNEWEDILTMLKRRKKWLELVRLVLLPVIYMLLVLAEHYGVVDHLRGLDKVKAVADNFNLSYAANASTPVYPSDAAWRPLMAMIAKYSNAKLRLDKTPQTVARLVASLSTQEALGE